MPFLLLLVASHPAVSHPRLLLAVSPLPPPLVVSPSLPLPHLVLVASPSRLTRVVRVVASRRERASPKAKNLAATEVTAGAFKEGTARAKVAAKVKAIKVKVSNRARSKKRT